MKSFFQYPSALSTVKSNSVCDLLISKGPEDAAQVMPDLTGLGLNAAVSLLEDRQLRISIIHSKGVILVTYPLGPGFLKKHVRVETDILGIPLDLFNDYFPPGKNINLLIPAGIKTKINVFVDHNLVKTSIIDPWNRDNDTGELLWE